MRLGCILCWGESLELFRSQVATAESCDLGMIGVGDTPFGWQDVHVALGVVARETAKARIGSLVTTPFMRHPAVAARAASSLFELSEGRYILGFGSGGSVPLGLNRKNAGLQELREYLLAMRTLLDGESIVWDGTKVSPLRAVNRVPIYLSAYWPRTMAMAAELADGVILPVGADTAPLAGFIAHLADSARAVGRDPSEIEIWARTFAAVRDTREAAYADIVAHLTTAAAFRLRPKAAFEQVPEHLKPAVTRFQREYDTTQHVVVGGPNSSLLQDPELTDYLARLTSIAGTPDEVARSIGEVAAAGVSCLISSCPGNADIEGTIRRFSAVGAEVLGAPG
jgi:alkanesulfonate monooxygenase SsuD/methylene tetrahydromethanopterin reductase-like flavin-dependent oxidoreductase (luciferase family)